MHSYRVIRKLWGGGLLYIWVEANVFEVGIYHAAGDVCHWVGRVRVHAGVGVRGKWKQSPVGICGAAMTKVREGRI
jgi:hypothetical protein